jgi:hypothetical protein
VRTLLPSSFLLLFLAGCPGGGDDGVDGGVHLVLTDTELTLGEGSQATVGVSLDHPPDETVTVTFESDVVATSPVRLTFTRDDYDVVQELEPHAEEDDDVLDASGEVTVLADGADPETIAVTVEDRDTVPVQIDAEEIVLVENDSATFEVQLGADPGGPISVEVRFGDAPVQVVPAQLQFDASSWDQPQTVTVTAADDADTADGLAELTVEGAEVSLDALIAHLIDDDVQDLVVAPSSLAVVEDGVGSRFTVRLSQQPTNELVIDLAVAGPVHVDPPYLMFDGDNWDAPQDVWVTPAIDADAVDSEADIELSSGALEPRHVTVSVAEDDLADQPYGDFLMTILPAGLPEPTYVHYRVSYSRFEGDLYWYAIALSVEDLDEVGFAITGSSPVDGAGAFSAAFDGMLPAAANPVTNTDLALDAVKHGTIVAPDFLCGTFTGSAGGLNLAGTTWAAVPIVDGELPEPVWACR